MKNAPALVLLVLIVSGCATRQPYPIAWSPLAASQGCDQLAGDWGDTGTTGKVDTSLSQVIFGRRFSDSTSVKFSFSERGLLVDVANPATLREPPRTFTDKQFVCRDGMLAIRESRWGGGGNELGFALGREATLLEFHPSVPYLVVKEKVSTTGVILIIPVRQTEERWHRFERMPVS
jgi:hypothetical protein